MAKMVGAWIVVLNPNRGPGDYLNLQVGFTMFLTERDLETLSGDDDLFQVRIRIRDDDTFSNPVIHSHDTFFVNVQDTSAHTFYTGVIVPGNKLSGIDSPFPVANIFARLHARKMPVRTNWANSQNEWVLTT